MLAKGMSSLELLPRFELLQMQRFCPGYQVSDTVLRCGNGCHLDLDWLTMYPYPVSLPANADYYLRRIKYYHISRGGGSSCLSARFPWCSGERPPPMGLMPTARLPYMSLQHPVFWLFREACGSVSSN